MIGACKRDPQTDDEILRRQGARADVCSAAGRSQLKEKSQDRGGFPRGSTGPPTRKHRHCTGGHRHHGSKTEFQKLHRKEPQLSFPELSKTTVLK
jgi:hypothetical protein